MIRTGSSTSTAIFWPRLPVDQGAAALRLFCFPYSGAGASMFHPWLSAFPKRIEVCPIELPGHGARLSEPLFQRLQPLVEDVARSLLPFLDRPFAFFGHSMGALLSFELARYLRKEQAITPIRLFVSGHGAPQLESTEEPIHALPEREFIEKIRLLNGTSPAILEYAELRDLLLPILRADFAVCETYTYSAEPPLDCPITALSGLQDSYVSREAIEAWKQQTAGAFHAGLFPGDHFYLNDSRPLLMELVARECSAATDLPLARQAKALRYGPDVSPPS